MKADEIKDIPKEKFQFVQTDSKIHDQKFETKPVGYFRDAWRRFRKNKSSVFGGIIIIILCLYALIVPLASKYGASYRDAYYSFALPKCGLFSGTGFWDGTKEYTYNQQTYDYYSGIPGAVTKDNGIKEIDDAGVMKNYHDIVIDSYYKVGYVYLNLSKAQYEELTAYEKSIGQQMLYPMIDEDQIECVTYEGDANAWYLTNPKGVADRTKAGDLQDIYDRNENGDYIYYYMRSNNTQYQVRVLYHDYYVYKNGHEASYLFGADAYGYDIFSRLAAGARLSLVLSIVVSLINLVLGVIIGALEGYYGGAFDMIMERIKDFLYEIPSIVIFSLFQMYFATKAGPVLSLLFAFVFFGWIGTSSTVRAQFYRFKGQEYVMAARTLGARDSRLIFRHILPNGIGYIITASVLTIPGVILSESVLSYLGILDLQSTNITSVGAMLSNGQATLSTYPHCIFFPSLFIALLIICFNMFGNGLRDAFNPSLRGAEN